MKQIDETKWSNWVKLSIAPITQDYISFQWQTENTSIIKVKKKNLWC